MNLGRTADSKIKIKTDGGLRAVECACCATVACGCASVPSELRSIIESATQITVNGVTKSWNGEAAQNQAGFGELSWFVSYGSGIICVLGDNSDQTVKLSPEPLTLEQCAITPMSVIGPPVTINGEAFRAVQAFPFFQLVLNITFS